MPDQLAMADLLLVNANVLTMDPARPRARSVAAAGGRIIAVDPGPELRAREGGGQRRDLRAAPVPPTPPHHTPGWWGGGGGGRGAPAPGGVAPPLADLYAA